MQNSGQKDELKASWLLRPMNEHDIEPCLRIWSQVQLTEAHSMVAAWLAIDPEGFYVAELEQNGRVIGMCAVVMNDETTAFVGFFGVEPEYQGFGVGRALWAKTFARLDQALNVGLHGVRDMAYKYKRAGFIIEDSVDMLVYESQPNKELELDCLSDNTVLEAQNATTNSYKLVVIDANCSECLFKKLADYDAHVVGHSRHLMLRKYLIGQHQADLLVMAVLKQEIGKDDSTSQVVGYGCVRADNNSGAMLGPLYSDCTGVADSLLKHLVLGFPLAEAKVYSVMPLSSNQTAVEKLEQIGFTKLDTCSRLFKKFVPKARIDKIHYILSPNFSLF